MTQSRLNIGVIDYDVLGVNGDNGNAIVLKQRAQLRGIDVKIHCLSVSESIPSSYDIYVMGSATRVGRLTSLEHLRRARGLNRALVRNVPLLAVMTSMHSLCEWYVDETGDKVPGLGILDIRSMMTPYIMSQPLVSVSLVDGVDGILCGYENHWAITHVGATAQPLGRVIYGNGNANVGNKPLMEDVSVDDRDRYYRFLRDTPLVSPDMNDAPVVYEGAVQGGIVATYMHGPILARNPQLADYLLMKAMGVDSLAPLTLESVQHLRRAHLKALGIDHAVANRFAAALPGDKTDGKA